MKCSFIYFKGNSDMCSLKGGAGPAAGEYCDRNMCILLPKAAPITKSLADKIEGIRTENTVGCAYKGHTDFNMCETCAFKCDMTKCTRYLFGTGAIPLSRMTCAHDNYTRDILDTNFYNDDEKVIITFGNKCTDCGLIIDAVEEYIYTNLEIKYL